MKPAPPPGCDHVLLEEQHIRERVAEIGARLSADHRGEDLRLITVLRGGLFFLSDLARAVEMPVQMDYLALSPYAPGKGGVARVTKDLDDDIAGASVVLVEDVVDTGLTVNYVLRLLAARKPERLEVCALLDKSARRIADIPIAYRGFEMPDCFLVGYGLDDHGRYRNLPYVACLRETAAAK